MAREIHRDGVVRSFAAIRNGVRLSISIGVGVVVAVVVMMAAVRAMGADGPGLTVIKTVDQTMAPAQAILEYTVDVENHSSPQIGGGLFTDEFPDELDTCSWTCTSVGPGSCDFPTSGVGDIWHLDYVPVGTRVTYEITCTFNSSAGRECAENVAKFNTMDPDTETVGIAKTCLAGVTIFFDGFESGDITRWCIPGC